ncbi:uncharacterized protein [Drosophila kikkawai]|uniref:Uncharacterized protein n=1 Tax=Drosophila kikkawai TaxID=30033 RepID=A0ABM4GJE1_DROKI
MNTDVSFLFDAVVTNLEVFGVVFTEPLQVAVKLKVMGTNLKLTSSRVNVSDFAANRELEFLSDPQKVRDNLEELGLELAASYQGSTLGLASVTFPPEFLEKISPTMSDLLHEDSVNLERRGDVVGSISILIRLTLKCEEIPPKSGSQVSLSKKSHVSCSGQGPTINPHDVMFLIGDPDPLLQIPSDPCSELATEEGDERLRLDLQRYRGVNRRVVFPKDDPCPQQKPSFSRLKNMTDKYSQIIDSVARKVKYMERLTCAVATSEPTVTARTPMNERFIPVPLGSEPEDLPGVKPIRYCPVCLYSMSWLPKYTPCPRCNTKARPMLPPQKQLTAMQIVAEQLVRQQGVEDLCSGPCRLIQNAGSEGDECPPCQCTCSGGKVCAHCRVRRMCEDIYHQSAPEPEQRMRLSRPGTQEDYCVIQDSQDDHLPYLSRVFHEMKHLYQLHDSKKLEALQLRCQSQTLLPRRSIKELTEALYQGSRTGSQTQTMQDHRQRAGHKRCVPSESGVSRRHGWNWKTSAEARTKGWRPGAILRASGHVMRYFLMNHERNLYQKILSDEDHRQRMAKPVLSISKRNGEIFVTLRPLASMGKRQKPITFRIVKSHLAVALRKIKRALKDQGFEKCSCHKSLMMCTCRDALEKFELNKALRRECQRRLIEPCPEHLVLTDTSVSDLEFDLDVHPPSRRCRSQIQAIRNSVNHGTQTSKKDMSPLPPKYRMQKSPYHRAFDCALGDRYMGTAFGWPGEQVFEDGVFGVAGGGPRGPNPMPCGKSRPVNLWGGEVKGEGPYAAFGGVGGGGRVLVGYRRRRGARGDGLRGPLGEAWKGFPVKGHRVGNSEPIPVRYPKRVLKAAQEAAKAAKQAEIDAVEKKKKGIDMVKYLQQKGTLRRPWNPNEGKDSRPMPAKRTKKDSGCITL